MERRLLGYFEITSTSKQIQFRNKSHFEGTSYFEMSIPDTIEAERNEQMSMYVPDEDSPPEVPKPPKEKRLSIGDLVKKHGEESVGKLTGFSMVINELLDILSPL